MSWIDKVFINNLRCLLFPKYFAAYKFITKNSKESDRKEIKSERESP